MRVPYAAGREHLGCVSPRPGTATFGTKRTSRLPGGRVDLCNNTKTPLPIGDGPAAQSTHTRKTARPAPSHPPLPGRARTRDPPPPEHHSDDTEPRGPLCYAANRVSPSALLTRVHRRAAARPGAAACAQTRARRRPRPSAHRTTSSSAACGQTAARARPASAPSQTATSARSAAPPPRGPLPTRPVPSHAGQRGGACACASARARVRATCAL